MPLSTFSISLDSRTQSCTGCILFANIPCVCFKLIERQICAVPEVKSVQWQSMVGQHQWQPRLSVCQTHQKESTNSEMAMLSRKSVRWQLMAGKHRKIYPPLTTATSDTKKHKYIYKSTRFVETAALLCSNTRIWKYLVVWVALESVAKYDS